MRAITRKWENITGVKCVTFKKKLHDISSLPPLACMPKTQKIQKNLEQKMGGPALASDRSLPKIKADVTSKMH